jgi:hypothetical protein
VNSQKRQRVVCGMGGGVDCRGDCQWHGSQQFNLNPHQRSFETYGMDKSENGSRCQCVCVAGGGNNDNHHLQRI